MPQELIKHHGEQTEQISAERQRLWIAAISRDDMAEKMLEKFKVSSEHSVCGIAAKPWVRYNPDWVSRLCLRHDKVTPRKQKLTGNKWNHLEARGFNWKQEESPGSKGIQLETRGITWKQGESPGNKGNHRD